jgi:hypothetical protein
MNATTERGFSPGRRRARAGSAVRAPRHCHRLQRRLRRAPRSHAAQRAGAAGGVRRAHRRRGRRAPRAAGVHQARWAEALPPVRAVAAGSGAWSVALRVPLAMRTLRWQLTDEAGRVVDGEADAASLHETARAERDGTWLCERVLQMATALAAGYHRLHIDGLPGETLLLATPGRCYRPPAVRDGGRVWGTAVQLYSLRSPRNWGIGDFSDLDELVVRMAAQGADIVGLNPLHALFTANPAHASPYSPSSRQQLDVLYIDVEAVDGFADCEPRAASCARPPSRRGWPRCARSRWSTCRRGGGQVRGAGAAVRALSARAPARTGRARRNRAGLSGLRGRARRGPAPACAVRDAACALSRGHRRHVGLARVARGLPRPRLGRGHGLCRAACAARAVPPVPAVAGRAPAGAGGGALRGGGHGHRPVRRPGGVGRPRRLRRLDRAARARRRARASARRPTSSTPPARTGACRRCGPTACAPTATASSSRRCAPACAARAPCASTT